MGDAMTDLFRAYFDPEKHAQELPVDLIVSDEKVDEDHVARIGQGGMDPSTMRPIVVIKHPKEEVYSVLDGHHRFRLIRDMESDTIRAAVVDDYVGLGFFLTKKGVFQPTPEFTKYVRVPLKRFVFWTTEFLKNPMTLMKKGPDRPPDEPSAKDQQQEDSGDEGPDELNPSA
jgi:hypothetical protein